MRTKRLVVAIALPALAVSLTGAAVLLTMDDGGSHHLVIHYSKKEIKKEELAKLDLGDRPRRVVEKSGLPGPATVTDEPRIFFPGTEEGDHNETSDGEDFGAPDSDPLHPPTIPGTEGGIKGRQPGRGPVVNDSMGVGGGSGSRHGGRYGGRANIPRPPENRFKEAKLDDAASTFGIDVDTASFTYVKRFLRHGQLPPADSIRIEEMINAFDIEDPQPPRNKAFATRVEVAGCPWNKKNRLVRISLRGREIAVDKRPVSNLVFLVDVSGSMSSPERLPLLKQGLRLLVEQLGERDRVALVVYAGAAGLVLPPTSGSEKTKILEAIEKLDAGGSTNGAAGIQLAYRTAVESFVEGGTNRVILCTDGDFNVGVSSPSQLEKLVEEKRKSGVFLTCLGFGVYGGDRTMQTLADKGNGHFAAIDDLKEAKRVLVEEMSGTLVTIAKDVKVQVAWNQERVSRWRLVGYEKRVMANADFKNDSKDSGDLGAGHRVTALYEVETTSPGELLALRLRWKEPDGETATEIETRASDEGRSFDDASPELKFVASVAAAGMLFRHSEHAGEATFPQAIRWAKAGLGADSKGQRREWVELLGKAARIAGSPEAEVASAERGS